MLVPISIWIAKTVPDIGMASRQTECDLLATPGDEDRDLAHRGRVEQTEASLYVLKMHGYQGYFGPDLNPERMPVQTALRNCFDAMHAANDRVNSLDHEKVIMSTMNPDKNRGWLEAYLIRQRALASTKLGPAPDFEG